MRYTENGAEFENLTTLAEAIELVKEDWSGEDMDDTATQLAQDVLPFIYGEIIHQWNQLPFEAVDQWREFVSDEWIESQGITGLMSIDLEVYYRGLFEEALRAVRIEVLNDLGADA